MKVKFIVYRLKSDQNLRLRIKIDEDLVWLIFIDNPDSFDLDFD